MVSLEFRSWKLVCHFIAGVCQPTAFSIGLEPTTCYTTCCICHSKTYIYILEKLEIKINTTHLICFYSQKQYLDIIGYQIRSELLTLLFKKRECLHRQGIWRHKALVVSKPFYYIMLNPLTFIRWLDGSEVECRPTANKFRVRIPDASLFFVMVFLYVISNFEIKIFFRS